MLRGVRLFKCRKCGKIFLAPDMEYQATVFSCPVPCPDCQKLCAPVAQYRIYRKLGIILND